MTVGFEFFSLYFENVYIRRNNLRNIFNKIVSFLGVKFASLKTLTIKGHFGFKSIKFF